MVLVPKRSTILPTHNSNMASPWFTHASLSCHQLQIHVEEDVAWPTNKEQLLLVSCGMLSMSKEAIVSAVQLESHRGDTPATYE